MIESQTFLSSIMGASNQMRRPISLSLRANRNINRALRAAYRKFDRTVETEKLLRKHLPC